MVSFCRRGGLLRSLSAFLPALGIAAVLPSTPHGQKRLASGPFFAFESPWMPEPDLPVKRTPTLKRSVSSTCGPATGTSPTRSRAAEYLQSHSRIGTSPPNLVTIVPLPDIPLYEREYCDVLDEDDSK